MKTNPAPTDGSNAVREATLKVAKLRRIVEAEEKLAHATKVRFKGARKPGNTRARPSSVPPRN
ncbi:MAG: hypothetical protein QM813_14550 [Verrucomicrobiota bacterium]